VPIEIVPMLSATGNTGVKPKIFAWISIDTSAVSRSSAGRFAYTDANGRTSVKFERFMTHPLETFGAVFAARGANESIAKWNENSVE